ncbi:hypothetical protein ACIA8K_33030 [Catenuloplanes sp. NPDC051500]|uniref:hypothetical protein n=1 Tax=Catenuloplanes sp. NPDC051500 TaxID=3363959 RepID=UPI0037A6C87E
MSHPPPPARNARPLGPLLVAPALLALLACYAVPGARTLWNSFHRISLLDDGGDEFTGFDNYSRIAETGFFGDIWYVLLLAVLPVLAACVLAPVLAWLAHRGGTPGRRIVRLGLVLPMVAVTPAGLALAWSAVHLDLTGEPLQAQVTVGRVLWVTLFGLLVGAGVTVFLAALRRSGAGRPAGAVITVGLTAGLAVVAYTLQTWTYPFVLTQGGPRNATGTPLLTIYNVSFRMLDFGAAAAGGTVLALLLGVLGLAAVAVLVLGRVRVDVVAPRTGVRPAGAPALIGALALLAVVLAFAGYGLWPWLSGLTADTPNAGSALNTWAPPLLTSGVGVGLAALAGFGIGVLRPLGRHSELLLFVFAPWLFVGTGPFSTVHFQTLRDLGLLDTPAALLPPVYLSIPSLVVFTLLFRGLAERHPGAPARTPLPALPMAAVAGGITYLTQAQDVFWQTLSVNEIDQMTTPAAALQVGTQFGPLAEGAAAMPMPVPAVVLFALLLAVLQWFYLDRLSIRTTEPPEVRPPGAGVPADYQRTAGYGQPGGFQPRSALPPEY